MRRFLSATTTAVLMATVLSHAQTPGTTTPDRSADGSSAPTAPPEVDAHRDTAHTWFVELASPPIVDGTPRPRLESEETSFHEAAAVAGIAYSETQHYRDLWNGIAVETDAAAADQLRQLPGVTAVYPVVPAYRSQQAPQGPQDPAENVAEMATALAMTGADIAQTKLGLSGRRIRVAVIDSGIDYDHPDLGGCFGRGCRVSKGWDFVGDAFNPDRTSATFNPVPVPDALPDDCDGHGTHVAGIIGANGTIKGVAPNVTFRAYRVFGCTGPTTTDVILAAMERAYRDGTDIINVSIGAPYQWPEYPTAQGANRLVHKGVVVVAAAGNDGTSGLYAAAAPGIGEDVISVASFDNTFANVAAFTVSPDDLAIGYVVATGSVAAPTLGQAPLARTGSAASAADACGALAPGSLAGKVALIRRGACGFPAKAANAQAAGAVGVAIYNNGPGRLPITLAGGPAVTIPVVSITASDGVTLDARLAAGPVTFTWTDRSVKEAQTTGNLISSFSSYGPTATLALKPDIGAPGGTIRSTLPLELGGFGTASGTSASAPYVAGAVALLLEARPRTSPAHVMALLQNNAKPHAWSGNPNLGALDLVHRQGAGMLAIDQAVTARAEVTPGRLSLGEFASGGAVSRPLTVSTVAFNGRRGPHMHGTVLHLDDECTLVTYTLGHEPAPATGPNTFAIAVMPAYASVTFSAPTVTVGTLDGRPAPRVVDEPAPGAAVADGEAPGRVMVSITPPANPNARLFGGYITLSPDDGGAVLRVPYLGYNGDYQAIQALTPTSAGFPWLAKIVGPNLVNQAAGATFTLSGTDTPFILYHLEHQSAHVRAEIVDAVSGTSFGFLNDERFAGRNSTATSFFAQPWNGTFVSAESGTLQFVPNGLYRIQLTVLKALGDAEDPAQIERWTSPTIGIARVGGATP